MTWKMHLVIWCNFCKNKAKQSFSNDREHGKLKTFFKEWKQIRHVNMTFTAIWGLQHLCFNLFSLCSAVHDENWRDFQTKHEKGNEMNVNISILVKIKTSSIFSSGVCLKICDQTKEYLSSQYLNSRDLIFSVT